MASSKRVARQFDRLLRWHLSGKPTYRALGTLIEIDCKWKKRKSMKHFRIVYLLLLIAWPGPLKAQEIKFIDLTLLSQRTVLHHPPIPPPDCKEGTCVGGASFGGSVGDGAPDRRDPHALGIYLLRVNPTDINPAKPFEVDFQVRNTGTVPLDIPVPPICQTFSPAMSRCRSAISALR